MLRVKWPIKFTVFDSELSVLANLGCESNRAAD